MTQHDDELFGAPWETLTKFHKSFASPDASSRALLSRRREDDQGHSYSPYSLEHDVKMLVRYGKECVWWRTRKDVSLLSILVVSINTNITHQHFNTTDS